MRRDEFSAQAPGVLLPIPGGVAFLPNALPPELQSSWQLSGKIDGATHALAVLAGKASYVPNLDLLLRPLLFREAIESARIEGTHTVIGEVLLQDVAGPPKDRQRALDNLEVIRYQQALQLGREWIAEGREFSPYLLRALHAELLKDTRGADRHPGEFRARQVLIGSPGDSPGSARFVPPPPEHVSPAVDHLVRYVVGAGRYPPLVDAALVHYLFESIHPFEDGNGRLGRLLIPLQLLSRGTLAEPLLHLSPFLERHRDEYLRLLRGVSTDGRWDEWLLFFLTGVEEQSVDSTERISRMLALHEDFHARLRGVGRSRVPLEALDLLLKKVIVSVPDVAAFAKCDYRTAKSAVAVLARAGIVNPIPHTYPQWWRADELLREVYE